MKPEVHERFSSQRLGLRDFVFVMRKDQILATRVQVESLSEFVDGHGRALDVPSGPAAPDGTLPESFVRLGRFPQSEVAGIILLVLVNIDARTIFHSGEIFF